MLSKKKLVPYFEDFLTPEICELLKEESNFNLLKYSIIIHRYDGDEEENLAERCLHWL